MAQDNLMHQNWGEYERSQDLLQKAISRLSTAGQQRLAERYGLSDSFNKQELTEDAAMALCEEAMVCLAESYPKAIEQFSLSQNPIETLAFLEESEVVWQSEARVIKHFDADGEEIAFLNRIREHTLQALQHKLDETAALCKREKSPENIALMLGVLAVMDQVLDELGHPSTSLQRQSFRKIAKDLNSP